MQEQGENKVRAEPFATRHRRSNAVDTPQSTPPSTGHNDKTSGDGNSHERMVSSSTEENDGENHESDFDDEWESEVSSDDTGTFRNSQPPIHGPWKSKVETWYL